MSYNYDDYTFHYQVQDGICFLLMSEMNGKHRIPYACLEDVQQRFVAEYGIEAPLSAHAFAYNEAFEPVLAQRVAHYNSGGAEASCDQIGLVKSQMDSVKETMVQNIESVLERGEKIELLVDKTDRLSTQAFSFESSSRNLRRTLYWRKMRCYAYIGVATVFLILMASASMCGGVTFHSCRRKSN